ncbi:MAG: YDG domain-containing protein [Chitinispirillia bacterium]|nr:YDG domain-containing protein [Chitinispirillia bacterium]MCL2267665.1 YDG domain-containing protein [Chitinispirillia bacterium]
MVVCLGVMAWGEPIEPDDEPLQHEITIDSLPASKEVSATYGDVPITKYKAKSSTDGTITYSSSDTAAANVGADGTVTIKAAADNVTITAKASGGDKIDATANYTINIAKRPVTIVANTSFRAKNKEYDGKVDAEIEGTPTFMNRLTTDASSSLTLVPGTAEFSDKRVGSGKTVKLTNYSLGGANADNYTLKQPLDVFTFTANITAKEVFIDSVAHTKEYDSTTTVRGPNAEGGLKIDDIYYRRYVLPGDNAEITGFTAAYTRLTVGADRMNLSAVTFVGSDAGNYKFNTSWPNIKVVALEPGGPVGITKASGMTFEQPDIILVAQRDGNPKTFNLNNIVLRAPVGVVGARSYSLGELSNERGILAPGNPPTLNGSTLTYRGGEKPEEEGSATLDVNIITDNYKNAVVTLTFQATDKMPFTNPETDIIFNPASVVYNGSPQTITAARVGTGYSTGGTFRFTYSVDGASPSDTLPKFLDPGEYRVTAYVENDIYKGQKTVTYTVLGIMPVLANLAYNIPISTNNKTYNAEETVVTVEWKEAFQEEGGTITVLYNDEESAPSDAGTYAVKARIAESRYYRAAELALGNFTISPKSITINTAESEIAARPYDGTADVVDITTVAFSGLEAGQTLLIDYDYILTNARLSGTGAGSAVTATVTLVPIGTAKNYTLVGAGFSKTGAITRQTPRLEHLEYTVPRNRRETGAAQRISVTTKQPLAGMGVITVQYMQSGVPAEPIKEGIYDVVINIAEGQNFEAASGIHLNEPYIILAPAKSIDGADVTVNGKYTYTGSPIRPENLEVYTRDGASLVYNLHYTLDYEHNTDAGPATVIVIGRDEYKDTVFATFIIEKKVLEPADLKFSAAIPYNGLPQPVPFTAKGLGMVIATYNGSVSVPVDVGAYEVEVIAIDEGANFTALNEEIKLGSYTIAKRTPATNDFEFTIPEGHLYTGSPRGIGPVSLPGTGYGDITVLYSGKEELPVEIGIYAITVNVEGGENYQAVRGVRLGNYRITDPVAVAGSDRLIPGAPGDIAIVAPKNLLTARFTAGPNPVAKGSKAVELYFEGGFTDGGKLTIYDALGNTVTEIACIGDRSRSPAAFDGAKRLVGSWDLTDRKGRPVAEGTYLISGAVSVNGKRERVSLIIGVR